LPVPSGPIRSAPILAGSGRVVWFEYEAEGQDLADDDRFRMMFYEEARELLISLEEGLVELERRQGDRAHLDRTFRAAHSLKGAAAMVGLPAIAEFTHGIEAVLDRIRAGKLAVDSDIITTLLEARDHLAAMVESDANHAPLPAPAELNQRLASLLRDIDHGGPKPPTAPPPPSPAPTPAVEPPPTPEAQDSPKVRPRASAGQAKPRPSRSKKAVADRATAAAALAAEDDAGADAGAGSGGPAYRITLKPGPDVLRRGINPLGVLDELRELGPTKVSTDPALVPTLDEIDPERCYLVWRIEVETEAPPERLDDVFLFVAEDSSIVIEKRIGRGAFEPVRAPQGQGAAFAPPARPAAAKVKVVEPEASAVAPPPPSRAKAASRHEVVREPTAIATTTPIPTAPPIPIPPAVAAAGGGAGGNGVKAPPAAPGAPMPPGLPAAVRFAPRIRVDANQLDDLVGLAGELAVLSDNLQGLRELAGANHWVHTLEALERVSRQVRDTTLDLRMVPVDELFSRFPRVVRDLADRFGKEIELRIVGQDTRLDRTIVEKLSDPMIHLIRNAVDHALETPEERLSRGKGRKGRISLSAGHEGDRVAIRVEDDGRGLDRERIVRKGVALGLVPIGTSPDDPRVDNLIFEPGFSTQEKVSELSGRGVGLDVVRDAVRALRGSLAVESTPGVGTAFIFRLPLTLALIDGLLVESAGSRYVVPLAQVEECVALDGSKPALSRGRPCVAVRGELVPMVPLRKVFHSEGEPPARQELLLTRHAGQRVGVAVDRLLGRVQAVIQALGEGLAGINRFSGATILGDGSVSLILDLAALVTESRANDQHRTPPAGGGAEGFR
jgi:two-component system, chemotaxis family, sensor kinase CheA